MSFFRERNKLRNEYSGYQEISDGLRSRLVAICKCYATDGYIGPGQEDLWVPENTLNHAIRLHLNQDSVYHALSRNYDEAFEAVEIFLAVAAKTAGRRYGTIITDFFQAFEIAGSVYKIDNDGHVVLRVEQKLAQNIDTAGEVLSSSRAGKDGFLDAVGGFMGRKETPENVVKGVFVAFEDYLKIQTKTKDYGTAVSKLAADGIISPTQKALLEKIYAYRSDTYGVGHAGNNESPKELDALWFIETVTPQILFIDRKLNQRNGQS